MEAKRILFVAQEISPYVPESPLTALGRGLPLGAIEAGREVRAFMPKWGNINERRNQLHEVIRLSGLNLTIDKTDHPLVIKVASLPGTRLQVYFVDSEDYFAKRLQVCDAQGEEYEDNFERAVFFARSVVETIKKLRWFPDVIHCQGWITSLLPLYLRTAYADEPALRGCRVLYTRVGNALTLPVEGKAADILEFRSAGRDQIEEFGDSLTPRQMEMLGIKFADGVSFLTEGVSAPTEGASDAELLDYARARGVPVLDCQRVDAERYVAFFDEVWGKDKVEEVER